MAKKISMDFESLEFIRNHMLELLSSEERTPLERVLFPMNNWYDFVHQKSFNTFGEEHSDQDDPNHFKFSYRNYKEYIINYNYEVTTALYLYSLLITDNKELLQFAKDVAVKNSTRGGGEYSEIVMLIEMLKTTGNDFKRSKEIANQSSE